MYLTLLTLTHHTIDMLQVFVLSIGKKEKLKKNFLSNIFATLDFFCSEHLLFAVFIYVFLESMYFAKGEKILLVFVSIFSQCFPFFQY